MAIAEDMARETAAALKRIEKGITPERALLSAGVAAVTAVIEGRSELTSTDFLRWRESSAQPGICTGAFRRPASG